MVEAKRFQQYLVLTTCFLSGFAGIISFVSLFTQGWLYGNCRFMEQEGIDSNFNYGLFGGTYAQEYPARMEVDISMTCSYSDNSCGLLCAKNSDRLSEVLDEIINGKAIDWTIGECPQTLSLTSILQGNSFIPTKTFSNDKNYDLDFINAYARLFTIIFLVISACLGLFSAGLSVWNTASNPIEIYFSIFGLYIYNGLALIFILISVIIWSVMFCTTLHDHPAFILMLIGQMHPTSVTLGWSYWINMLAIALYVSSICALYTRSYLISKEPKLKVDIGENKPAEILLF